MLSPMIEVAQVVKGHLMGALNFFRNRIANAAAEGLSSKIATSQTMAYGIRNKDHFRTAVMFRCDGLQLYPVSHQNSG